jgi:hypothetical protein
LTGVLKGNGISAFTAGTVSLTTEVTGTLPVANGGTGVATLAAGIVRANGTSAFTTGAIALTTADVTGVLPIANGGTGFSTNPYGQLSSQMAASSVASFGAFAKLAMDTDFDSTNSSGFDDGGADNRLHYTGATTRRFLIFASTDILDSAAGSNYSIMLYKNGTTALLETECRANTAGKGSTFLAKLVTSWIVSLSQNDFVELFVASITGDGGTPQRMRLVATPV